MDSSQLLSLLKELNQEKVIEKYNSSTPEEQNAFLSQINNFEKWYPGGLKEYIERSKLLLKYSLEGKSTYEGFSATVPLGENLTAGNQEFYQYEEIGMEELKDTCFILVAGGLGERLGYPGIKIGITTDLISKRIFFDIYSSTILSYEKVLRKKFNLPDSFFIPFVIMTSDDTNDKTIELLKTHDNFGMKPNQIRIIKQEKCPALLDNDCHLALKEGKLELDTKPHGHGDVHSLLYSQGIIEDWLKAGKKWAVFFQDTNALAFYPIPSAIGVSKKNNVAMNSITIARRPGEALGAICKLVKKNGESMTTLIMYNELDDLLKIDYNSQGDVANSKGYSDFPGGTNIMVFELNTYYAALVPSKGLIPEFINPKYADSTKTKFKSSSRLECRMDYFPKLFTKGEKVSFVNYDRLFCFSTVKNNLIQGITNYKKKILPESAFSCEMDIFESNVYLLKDILGVLEIVKKEEDQQIEINPKNVYGTTAGDNSITITCGPKIIIFPSFAPTLTILKEKITGKITMTNRSTLILKEDVKIEGNLYIDGIMTVEKDILKGEEIKVENKKKHAFESLKEGEGEIFEKIRGYTLKEKSFDN